MNAVNALNFSSTDFVVFYAGRWSVEQTPPRHDTPTVPNCAELSGVHVRDVITISPVTSEPKIVTIDSDTNKSNILFGYDKQEPIIAPSLRDLHLPPNPFNVWATMAVVQPATSQYNERGKSFITKVVRAVCSLDATD